MAGYLRNPWITFLRQYGPVASNDAAYDEHVINSARRNGVRPLRFDTGGLLGEIVENFRSPQPRSVILTGTAGDGKTWLCREVWELLGGDAKVWSGNDKVRTMELPGGARLVVLKDLSELQAGDARLADMAEAIFTVNPREVFLVAANDGQLRQAWENVPRVTETVEPAARVIEGLLVKSMLRASHAGLTLYNLSRQSSSQLMERVVDAVLAHDGWQGCHGCAGQSPDPAARCPVWENQERLRDPLLRERLRDLLELCDESGFHLPTRQLLILASNMLLGHPDTKDDLLRCQDVPAVVQEGTAHRGAIYRNTFGENLPEGRREGTVVFDVLRRFGIGEETSNRIDNLLVYGCDDPDLTRHFDELFRADALYGANAEFASYLDAYLAGADPEKAARFTDVAIAQRQRLFFTMSRARAAELGLWELTVFRFAGEYLDRVLAPLRRGGDVDEAILKRMVHGMNRVFTGTLTSDEDNLWLASSGSHSQARVCRIVEHKIPVEEDRGARVVIQRRDDKAALVVSLDRGVELALPLHLVRYEFLARVAEGALPSNFSRECYEDILSFKSRLLRMHSARRGGDGRGFSLQLLKLDDQGRLLANRISVMMGDPR